MSWGHRVRGWDHGVTPLHEQRLDAVVDHLLEGEPQTVLDLGCGAGALLDRLVDDPRVHRIIGLDASRTALRAAEARMASSDAWRDRRVSLRQGSVTDPPADLGRADAAALVEVLEHLEPDRLSALERSVFRMLRPTRVVITTPNRDYNAVYGLTGGQLRHPHHRFEWGRRRFERWATGVAERAGYGVQFQGVGVVDACYGSPTQLAVFSR